MGQPALFFSAPQCAVQLWKKVEHAGMSAPT